MTRQLLSIIQLRTLLNTEEYNYKAPERHYIKEFETHNKWTTQEVFDLFDTLIEAGGGNPPKPIEYIETGVRLTKNHWFSQSDTGRLAKYKMGQYGWDVTYLQWNDNMEKAIRWRLSRMYESMMAEYSAVCAVHTLYPNTSLLTSSELDLCAGVDLVVVDRPNNKIVYIHVTKNSNWTDQNIKDKANKQSFLLDKFGNKHWWQRRFTDSHVVFKYDKFDSESTSYVNGHFIFKPDYVQKEMERVFQGDVDIVAGGSSELLEFHNFLVDKGISERGINKMIITFKMSKGE